MHVIKTSIDILMPFASQVFADPSLRSVQRDGWGDLAVSILVDVRWIGYRDFVLWQAKASTPNAAAAP